MERGPHFSWRFLRYRTVAEKTSGTLSPWPDIMTPTLGRSVRWRCITYSSPGSWSFSTQWMHSTGHELMAACGALGQRLWQSPHLYIEPEVQSRNTQVVSCI